MTELYLDTETFCELPPKVLGTYEYARRAEILIVTYAFGEGPVRLWDRTADPRPPADLVAALRDPAVTGIAHNSMFDRNVLACAGFPVPIERWRCTMVQALAHALPAALGDLGRVLGLPEDQAKIKDGKKLITRFCTPAPKNHKLRRYDRTTHPEEWARFCKYAVQDIVAMRECRKRMPSWNYSGVELEHWFRDQRINDRGFAVDRELVQAAVSATEEEQAILRRRFQELTGLDRPSQRDPVRQFLAWRFGIALEDTRAETLRGLLRDASPELAEIIQIIIESNKTSTSKYAALMPAVSPDGRFRGGLQFDGAGRTRRYAGRLFQPQNLPSRGLPKAESVDLYIDAVKAGVHTSLFDNLMLYNAAAVRGCVTAPKGRRINAADLSNIEGRMLAWVAGEDWKIQAFRDYDAGTGPDLYKVTAGIITGVDPWLVEKKIRNSIGKVSDLASGYMGGVAGYQQFARVYGVKMADYWGVLQETAPAAAEKARANLDKPWARAQLASLEISETEWLASEACKLAWRARHPATVSFWYGLDDAMRRAIAEPGSIHTVTRVKVSVRPHAGHMWMIVLLPSGRRLCYFHPRVTEPTKENPRGSIQYWGMAAEEGSTARAWIPIFTHGGKATGNCLAAGTQVLTDHGLVAIERVTAAHRVWDGGAWVSHSGLIDNGLQETGTWLGIQLTRDHLIFVGNSWKCAQQMDRHTSRAALSAALGSVRSWSFALVSATRAAPVAGAIAAATWRSTRARYTAVLQHAAHLARGVLPASPTPNPELGGRTDTRKWSRGATTLRTPLSRTTGAAASGYGVRGWQIATRSLTTWLNSLVQRTPAWTSIVKTTTAAMSRATFGWCLGRSMPGTGVPQHSLSFAECAYRALSSASSSSRSGGPEGPSRITSNEVGISNGSWQNTTHTNRVFDLANAGPRNRFTVLTAQGFAIVHNCVQSSARDLLVDSMPLIERSGYDIVLSVHDEIVTESDQDEVGLVAALATNPPWAAGLPLSAAGFSAARYKKED